MLDYEAVPTESTKALRALASLAYKDVNEVVLSSTRYRPASHALVTL
jgi:hypothetical protein